MRSRTELVTTTFDLDSDEEDYSPDDDDSEEDWRPNKKPQQKQPRPTGTNSTVSGDAGGSGRKRKGAAPMTAAKNKKRTIPTKVSDEDFESDDDDDDELETEPSDDDFDNPSTSKRSHSLPPKKQFVQLAELDLLLKKRDILDKNWLHNSRLCIWRKDEQTNLLQKYLRVKTSQDADRPHEQQLIFTSTSVYSSWDEEHISDFIDVKVKCLDRNNRRIQLDDIGAIKKQSIELQAANRSSEINDENDNNDETADQEPAACAEENKDVEEPITT
ncbi:uncharacterized protein LOC6566489 [Drosophila grimshawi]|uniref:GH13269 n=1 Tax=Drosophila grimshawi TaxID=7222 RepID=B4JQ54_DROGR|nr:uncharacterized protein LOC6566489 [Drosophila grimshawi]EDV99034.1 GH13269 [Drosophila grimshawi]